MHFLSTNYTGNSLECSVLTILNTNFCVKKYVYVRVYACTHVHTYTHACVHIYVHMQMHTHTYIPWIQNLVRLTKECGISNMKGLA
jgi:hypothetical protein